jgi:hypothetical protein
LIAPPRFQEEKAYCDPEIVWTAVEGAKVWVVPGGHAMVQGVVHVEPPVAVGPPSTMNDRPAGTDVIVFESAPELDPEPQRDDGWMPHLSTLVGADCVSVLSERPVGIANRVVGG